MQIERVFPYPILPTIQAIGEQLIQRGQTVPIDDFQFRKACKQMCINDPDLTLSTGQNVCILEHNGVVCDLPSFSLQNYLNLGKKTGFFADCNETDGVVQCEKIK